VAEDLLRFDGRVALVTGAGKGIGRAHVLALATRGAKVLVNNRAHAGEAVHSADSVVAEIRAAGGEALAHHADAADPDAPRALVDAALSAWGRIDIVVHNAAIGQGGFFTKLDPAEFERMMRIDFMAPVALTRAVLPHMRAIGYGRMLFVTSAAGLYGNRGQTAYSSAKAALIAFMRSVQLEESGYDFRANALAPFAETQMTDPYWPEAGRGRFPPVLPAAAGVWLVHERCEARGEIVLAGARTFRVARMVEGAGLRYDSSAALTPEAVARDFDRIAAPDGAIAQPSADACFRRFVGENARSPVPERDRP
jgi:NAD(P)-dependent dehydrogenase (short-subunit alcohol dehydrogenase family)